MTDEMPESGDFDYWGWFNLKAYWHWRANDELLDARQMRSLVAMLALGMSPATICQRLDIPLATFLRWLRRGEQDLEDERHFKKLGCYSSFYLVVHAIREEHLHLGRPLSRDEVDTVMSVAWEERCVVILDFPAEQRTLRRGHQSSGGEGGH